MYYMYITCVSATYVIHLETSHMYYRCGRAGHVNDLIRAPTILIRAPTILIRVSTILHISKCTWISYSKFKAWNSHEVCLTTEKDVWALTNNKILLFENGSVHLLKSNHFMSMGCVEVFWKQNFVFDFC